MAAARAMFDLAQANLQGQEFSECLELVEARGGGLVVSGDRFRVSFVLIDWLLISTQIALLQIRNENWTFESITSNHPVPIGLALFGDTFNVGINGWYYEVRLMR